ncbi:MAG: CDP-alcohol phosphatidyltransferase family protein [Ktedonobacteraceae bacterium]
MRHLPNILSLGRLVATVVIFVLVLINQPWAFLTSFVLFVLASVTDFFDGYLARRYKVVSSLGVFLDLTADKVLVCAILIALIQVGFVPAWIVFIVVTREFLVSGLRSMAATKGHVIPAGIWGKQKTFITLIAMSALLLAKGLSASQLSLFPLLLNFNSHTLAFGDWLLFIADVLLILAVIWTAFSGIEYMIGALPIFRNSDGKNASHA